MSKTRRDDKKNLCKRANKARPFHRTDCNQLGLAICPLCKGCVKAPPKQFRKEANQTLRARQKVALQQGKDEPVWKRSIYYDYY